jgi:PAS domain S-box-containing protein
MAPNTPTRFDLAPSLALAVIASSHSPLLLLDGALKVIAASTSFCHAFGLEPAKVVGSPVLDLGSGEWNLPQLKILLDSTAKGHIAPEAYEIELVRKGHDKRCLALHAQKLDYDGKENIRLLLAVSDITEARSAEKLHTALLQEKAVLLQEVQHRIANSLQIIASVLMQSARQVQAEDTRNHLYVAHGRVMSIAAVQRQLVDSGLGAVELRSYLTQLCKSLGASMIGDPDKLSIEVQADDSSVDADRSVSIGLIVTELVINALKHAFPDHSGKITVEYRADGSGWLLSVRDDGVGMPTGPSAAKPGLGTGIVEALARQLDAEVCIAASNPGTQVSIVHSQALTHMPVSGQDMNTQLVNTPG